MERRKVLLLSGGLDSVAAWWALGQPEWRYFRVAREAEVGESEAVNKLMASYPEFAKKGEVVEYDLSIFRRETWGWPREPVIAMACWAMGFDEVMTGWHLDDTCGRPTEPTDKALETLVNSGAGLFYERADVTFRFTHPLKHLSRRELVEAALEAGAPPESLLASWSCVNQSGKHCGECLNCHERHIALLGAGIEDTTEYASEMSTEIHCLERRYISEWYVEDYKKAMGIPDDELLLFGTGIRRGVEDTVRFDLEPLNGGELSGLRITGDAKVDRLYLGAEGVGCALMVLDDEIAVSSKMIEQIVDASYFPIWHAYKDKGHPIVWLGITKGSVESVEAVYTTGSTDT